MQKNGGAILEIMLEVNPDPKCLFLRFFSSENGNLMKCSYFLMLIAEERKKTIFFFI